MLSKLKQKKILNRRKLEQDAKESRLDKQVGEAVVHASPTIKDQFRGKVEKHKAEEEQTWEKEENELTMEACRKAKDEEQEKEKEEDHYCREAHGKERKQYFETKTEEEKIIRL